MNITIIIVSLLSSIIFGIIDSTFFLSIETYLVILLKKFKFLDDYSIPLIIGSLSASLSIFVASYIHKILKRNIELIENPFLDSLGIIIGGSIIVTIYYLFLKKNIKIKRKLTHIKVINKKHHNKL